MPGMAGAVALALTGLVAGVVGGLLGIGGCSIMLPVLVFLYHYPEPVAIGTTITAVILTAASGAVAHIRMRNVDRDTVVVVGSSGAAGALVGDAVFNVLSERMWALDLVLGAAFIYVALRMVVEGMAGLSAHYRAEKAASVRAPAAAAAAANPGSRRVVPGSPASKALLGFSIGVISGVVGLGGGYALVPAFIYLLGAPVKLAVGTSLPSFLPIAVTSAVPKLLAGKADAFAATLLGVGTVVGAQAGARLVPRSPTWLIKLLFGALFTVVSLKFILKGLMVLHS